MTGHRRRLVVVGAGPTAIGVLSRLRELINEGFEIDVSVIERESLPGGLASTVTDVHGFSWDLGVHVTGATRFPAFLHTLQNVVPEWHCIERVVKADMAHVISAEDPLANYVPYPVQSSVPYFPEPMKSQCLSELEARTSDESDFSTFEDFSSHYFGKTLQRVFIRPYNQKIWTVSLEAMNCRWVEGRVPKVDLTNLRHRTTLSSEELQQFDESRGVTFFRYPADCVGMGELWRRVVAKFPQEWFHFQTDLVSVQPAKRILTVKSRSATTTSTENLSYDFLISTIPLTELGKKCGLCPDLNLIHSKVVLVGIGLKLPQTSFTQELSWAYFPRPEIVFYRCTVISNFSPLLVPDPKRFWSVLCEIGVGVDEEVEENDIVDRTIQGLLDTGIIEGGEQVHSVWTKVLDHGYPIPSINRESELQRAHELLEAHDIYSRGRFGGWKYEHSNQDCSFEIGRQLVDRLLCDGVESLYHGT